MSERENVTDDYSTTLEVMLEGECEELQYKYLKEKARIIKAALINFRFRTIKKMTAIDTGGTNM